MGLCNYRKRTYCARPKLPHTWNNKTTRRFFAFFGALYLVLLWLWTWFVRSKALGKVQVSHRDFNLVFKQHTTWKTIGFSQLGKVHILWRCATWEEEETCKNKLFFLSQLTHVCQELKVLQVVGIFFVITCTIVYNKFIIEDGTSMEWEFASPNWWPFEWWWGIRVHVVWVSWWSTTKCLWTCY